MLASAFAGTAQAQTGLSPPAATGDENALAIPRGQPGSGDLPFPQPLAPSLARRIRQIFAWQQQGDIPAALRATARLDDDSPLGRAMFGHILADRYLGPYMRPDADHLTDWLTRWPDLPDAPAVYRLLLSRLPDGAKPPPAPIMAAATVAGTSPPPPPSDPEDDPDALIGPELHRNPDLDRTVADFARHRGEAGVVRLLRRTAGLSPLYSAQLRGEAARVLFTQGQDAEALSLGMGALRGCGADAPACAADAALPAYIAGLAAWRMGRSDLASALFEAGWRAPLTTGALRSACAFWAARARSEAGEAAGATGWLRRAAAGSDTFYGAIARRRLHWRIRDDDGERASLSPADLDAVAATGPGLRAFALLQVGQPDRAAAELKLLWPAAVAARPLARAVVLVADTAGLADTAAEFAALLPTSDPVARTMPNVKLPPLHPAGGFRVDPAMLYAIARTESNFDPRMVSGAGARGILQIMPETARDVVGHAVGEALYDPATNLDLGQRYIAYLADQDSVNGDLIRLLASYNAGPAAFAHWAPQIRGEGDPLLFMESIPVDETRTYVRRVLSSTWLYAQRLHLPAPSLDDLAAGRWPRYRPAAAPAALH